MHNLEKHWTDIFGRFDPSCPTKRKLLTFPVESVEPLVLLDVPDPSLLVAKSLSTVVSEIILGVSKRYFRDVCNWGEVQTCTAS